MPFVNNNGVKIHYEVEGQGPPLVMQHGLGRSIEDWQEYGYVNELGNDYRLILVDARGHGLSDKPHDQMSYRSLDFVNDIVMILNTLGINKAGYMGYSMGGSIGFHGIARYNLSQFSYLILGGMSPYNTEIEQQHHKRQLESWQEAAEQGMEVHVSYLEKRDGVKFKPNVRARLIANDPVALFAVMRNLATWSRADDILPNIQIPCFIYVGEDDIFFSGAKKGAGVMPDVRFVSFPGLNHSKTYMSSGLVLPHVKKFLAEATKK